MAARSWEVISYCVSQERFLQKPCWNSTRMLWRSRCYIVWDTMICFATLHQIAVTRPTGSFQVFILLPSWRSESLEPSSSRQAGSWCPVITGWWTTAWEIALLQNASRRQQECCHRHMLSSGLTGQVVWRWRHWLLVWEASLGMVMALQEAHSNSSSLFEPIFHSQGSIFA